MRNQFTTNLATNNNRPNRVSSAAANIFTFTRGNANNRINQDFAGVGAGMRLRYSMRRSECLGQSSTFFKKKWINDPFFILFVSHMFAFICSTDCGRKHAQVSLFPLFSDLLFPFALKDVLANKRTPTEKASEKKKNDKWSQKKEKWN